MKTSSQAELLNAYASNPTKEVDIVPVSPQKTQATMIDDKQANRRPATVRTFFLLARETVKTVEQSPKTARTDIVTMNRVDERLTRTLDGELESTRGTFEPNTIERIAPMISVVQTIMSMLRIGSLSIIADKSSDHTIVNVANDDATACPQRAKTASETIAESAINAIPAMNVLSILLVVVEEEFLLLCESF